MKFNTPVEISSSPHKLTHGQGILTIGSCFATEVGTRLYGDMFQVEVNPFGALYNPISILNALDAVISGKNYTDADFFLHDGLWHCPDFHSAMSNTELDKAITLVNFTVARLRAMLPKLKWLVITLGSARCFVDNTSGRTVGNCHKLPATRFTIKDLSIDDITAPFSQMLDRLRTLAPDLKVLLTVSPVRHKSYGMHQDRLSKATLMLAADWLCRNKGCLYFPAYEIMQDELRDYRFYAADMVHPSEVAVDYIYERFAQTYFTPETAVLAATCCKITRRLAHRYSTPEARQAAIATLAPELQNLAETHPCLLPRISQLRLNNHI